MQALLQTEFSAREKSSAKKLTVAEQSTIAEVKTAVADAQRRSVENLPDDDELATAETSKRIAALIPILATTLVSILARRTSAVRGEEQRAMIHRVVTAYGATAFRLPASPQNAHDASQAALSAQTISTRWGQAAMAVNAPYRTVAVAPPSALALVEPTVKREVATTIARAFNGGREDILDRYDGLPGAYKIWSAVLDIATCKHCRDLDGDYVAFGKQFRMDPPIHPNCRCIIETLITAPDLAKRMPGFRIDYEEFKRFVKKSRLNVGRTSLDFASKSMKEKSPVVLQKEILKRK